MQLFDAKGNIVVTSVQSATGDSSGALVQGSQVDLVLTTHSAQPPHHAGGARPQFDLRRAQGQQRDEHGRDRLGRRTGLRGLGGGGQPAGERQRHPGGDAPGDQRGLGGHGHRERRAPGGSNVLAGSLSVQGNEISSAATGNEALGATAARRATASWSTA
jgi:hypothetical protein